MKFNNFTKSLITIMVIAFVLVTFLVFFGGYAYELKWHVENFAQKIIPQKQKKVEVKNIDLRPFNAALNEKFKKNWKPPITNVSSSVKVEFDILRNGKAENIRIIKSSKNEKTDKAVVDTIRKSAPYPPLPLGFEGENLHVNYTFEINAVK